MKENSFFKSLPFKLLVGVVLGIVIGLVLNATDGSGITVSILNVVVTLKYILGQAINFCVPLIIIGFIAPSITKLGNSASRMPVSYTHLPEPHLPDTKGYPLPSEPDR